MSACRCWFDTYALGHEGHCCFLRDDLRGQSVPSEQRWRRDEDICHVPGGGADA